MNTSASGTVVLPPDASAPAVLVIRRGASAYALPPLGEAAPPAEADRCDWRVCRVRGTALFSSAAVPKETMINAVRHCHSADVVVWEDAAACDVSYNVRCIHLCIRELADAPHHDDAVASAGTLLDGTALVVKALSRCRGIERVSVMAPNVMHAVMASSVSASSWESLEIADIISTIASMTASAGTSDCPSGEDDFARRIRHFLSPQPCLLSCPLLQLSVLGFETADVSMIFALLNSDGWRENIAVMDIPDAAAAAAYIAARPHGLYRSCGVGVLRLDWIAGDRVIPAGVAGLIQRPQFEGTYDVGYALLPEYQGKGLVVTAVRLLLEYAHYVLGAERIAAVLREGNLPSHRVLSSSGFPESPSWTTAEGDAVTWYYKVGLAPHHASSC